MTSPSKERVIRVVLTRQITYQGPESWVNGTVAKRIIGPMVMGYRDGVPEIVSAVDQMASGPLEPSEELSAAAEVTTKMLYAQNIYPLSLERTFEKKDWSNDD